MKNRQKQRAQDHGLYAVSKFMDDCFGTVVVSKEQKHTQAHTACLIPVGHNATPVNLVGGIAMEQIDDKAQKGLRESPKDLPHSKEKCLHSFTYRMLYFQFSSSW